MLDLRLLRQRLMEESIRKRYVPVGSLPENCDYCGGPIQISHSSIQFPGFKFCWCTRSACKNTPFYFTPATIEAELLLGQLLDELGLAHSFWLPKEG